jgi:hypothetical protein
VAFSSTGRRAAGESACGAADPETRTPAADASLLAVLERGAQTDYDRARLADIRTQSDLESTPERNRPGGFGLS